MALMMTGCLLQTRADLKEAQEKQVLQSQMTNLQKSTADAAAQDQDIQDEIRQLNGRVETLESQSGSLNQQHVSAEQDLQKKINDLATKQSMLTDSVSKQEQEIQQLAQAVTSLQQVRAMPAPSGKGAKKGVLAAAQQDYDNKNWKKAILEFAKYRDQNPKGKHYAAATYKMAICFQELGMKQEARSFFDEVVAKYPGSSQAKKAKFRLKQLK